MNRAEKITNFDEHPHAVIKDSPPTQPPHANLCLPLSSSGGDEMAIVLDDAENPCTVCHHNVSR